MQYKLLYTLRLVQYICYDIFYDTLLLTFMQTVIIHCLEVFVQYHLSSTYIEESKNA